MRNLIFLLLIFLYHLLALDIDRELQTCSTDIVRHINYLIESHPEALLIPLGRAWIADKFGVALLPDHQTSEIEYHTNTNFRINVTMCKLPFDRSLSFYRQPNGTLDDICFISLGSRLVGKEIIHIESEVIGTHYHNTSIHLPCYWQLHFTHPILFHGDYKIEIYTSWIHEFNEPTSLERGRSKTARINDGVSKSLNGLGFHPFHVANATKYWFDFTGYILRGNSRTLYYIHYNNTKNMFNGAETFLSLGFTFGVEKQVPVNFLESYEDGDLFQHITNITALKASLPRPQPVPDEVFKLLDSLKLFNFGSTFYRDQGMIFDLPLKIKVLKSPSMEIDYNTQYENEYEMLPLCKHGDEPGRWVYKPSCENISATVDECAQTAPPYHIGDGSYKFPLRSRNMVWRPYNCRLGRISRSITVDRSVDTCSNLKRLLRNRHDDNSDSSIAPSSNIVNTSTLRYCLKESGVGFISGFGDSLGDEMRDNFANMLGNYNESSPNILCHYAQALNHVDILIGCINSSVYSLFGDKPLQQHSNNSIRQIVLVTNFKVQHSVGGLNLSTIEFYFKKQAIMHKELEISLKRNFNITYRRIYYSAIAVHGFRLGGLTPLRQEHTNKLARDYLVPAGWEVLDAYNMTVGRVDGTWDTTHYRGGVSYAIASVLVNMLCAAVCEGL